MKYKIQPYSIHELGQRQNQEDSLFPAHGQSQASDCLFILCDGMGGHEKGEVASATVCETISQVILSQWNPAQPLSDELLQQAISAAYDALDAKDDDSERKMGTTLTLLCLHAEGATVAHIGDSRVYQFRPGQGVVFRTEDHSLVNDLIKIGEITEEEAKTHPQKNVITRAMQPHQPHRAKADIAHLTDIQSGDYFFLCSDGMLEQTSDDNLANIITKVKTSNEQKIEMLRSVTEENKDNHTAHLIYIDKVEGRATEDSPAATQQTSLSFPNGTWVQVETPENSNAQSEPSASSPLHTPKKSRLPLYIIIGVVALAIIAGGAFAAWHHFSSSEKDTEMTDSVNAKKGEANDTASSSRECSNVGTASDFAKLDSLRKDSLLRDSLKKDSIKEAERKAKLKIKYATKPTSNDKKK